MKAMTIMMTITINQEKENKADDNDGNNNLK